MRTIRSLAAGLAVAALVLAGCGDSDDSGADDGTEQPETVLTAMGQKLPQSVKDAEEIKVCSDIAYAPVEFYEEGTRDVQGIDPDLADAMGEELGIRFTFENTTFDGIIPALEAKRCDIIMSAMSDTAERQRSIDFVDYFTAGTSIIVKKGNPENIQSLDDLCGKAIGIQRGTTQEEVATAQKAACEGAASTLEVQTFDTDTEALQQLKLGRTVADLNDFPVAAYNAQQAPEDYEVVGEQIEAGPYGIGFRKDDTVLRDVLKEALEATKASGAYASVLEEWDVTQGAIDTFAVNGGS